MPKEEKETKKYYLREFEYFDGECFITLNIVSIRFDRKTIEVAVTNRGKINVIEYDLRADRNGDLYFEFGPMYDRIALDDFEEVDDETYAC